MTPILTFDLEVSLGEKLFVVEHLVHLLLLELGLDVHLLSFKAVNRIY